MRGRVGGLLVVGMIVVVATACSGDSDGNDTARGDHGDQTQEDAAVPGESVAVPTEVTGPVTGGTYGVPFNPMPAGMAERYGYVEEEYFVTGTATAFTAADGQTFGSDGKWSVTPATDPAPAPYTIRVLVRRPADADGFNGTVLVEWLNVTAGMDSDPDFGSTHDRILQDGWAYVGVSAQKGGIEGGGGLEIPVPGFDAKPLKEWDPQRYGPLSHPGDAYSYDIYSQVAQLLRRPDEVGVDVLDGAKATAVIAAGESQSAIRMLTYVNAVHPVAQIYDGFLIHSRGSGGAPLAEAPTAAPDPVPPLAYVRDDLDEPVMQFETETDLFGLDFAAARQPDTDKLRTWEVAGTAHADQNTLDYGVESGHEWAPDLNIDFGSLCGRLNEGPQAAVLRKAVTALRTWIVDGEAPAEATPMKTENGAIVRDDHGNAQGGVRTPPVDAPIALLSGERGEASDSIFCSLFGRTVPFDSTVLAQLYPTNDDFVGAVSDSADAAVTAGFLLEDDAADFVTEAKAAHVPA